ncbi:MAG: hypothetical protein QXK89_02980 [Candidatus Bathyarchaeia archaeon]
MASKYKVLLKLLGAVIAVVLSAVILYEAFIASSLLKNYGILSVFLAALFSHLTIVARGLFLPLFFSLTSMHNPLTLGLAAGLGGGLGELVAYYWGLGIKEALNPNEQTSSLPKWAEKYGSLMLLLFASSPLPDTPIVLLAGSLRFPLWKLMLIQITGKSILYSFGAIVGGFIFMELKSAFEEVIASTIILIASIVLCIIVSWNKSREKILYGLNKLIVSKIKR